MSEVVLALDLGTGGCKASLWDSAGRMLGEEFEGYPTMHPRTGWNEQEPADWRDAVIACTRRLVTRQAQAKVSGVALSGHSLGIVLLDGAGRPLEPTTPIWSDTRAVTEAGEIFADLDERSWYLRTGNGFTPALYPLAKARWYARHRPEAWAATRMILGSKDWINHWLTGSIATDHSYASGSGMYELASADYADDFLQAAGVARAQLPEPVASHERVGDLTAEAAGVLGLTPGTPVFAGAVDNASMALGSSGVAEGRCYASLGSSSWMTVTSATPVLDVDTRPYVFAHAIPGYYASALSTFSTGTSIAWVRDLIGGGRELTALLDEAMALDVDAAIPTCVPTLGGGTPLEGGPSVRGVFAGLDLSHGAAHLMRACMEGIAFSLERSLKALASLVGIEGELLISGGGARHGGWNQLYADIIGQPLVRTSVDQQAAALGAAAIAWVGLGAWSYPDAERPHLVQGTYRPDPRVADAYQSRRTRFRALQTVLAETAGTFEFATSATPWTRDGSTRER